MRFFRCCCEAMAIRFCRRSRTKPAGSETGIHYVATGAKPAVKTPIGHVSANRDSDYPAAGYQ